MSRSVLIVEDEAIIAWHLQAMASRLGYVVCATVATEDAAVAAAAEHRPDIVLMDVRLAASGDGVRAAERIRREGRPPIVFCTAHADDQAFRARTASMEHSAVLGKPVREDLLKEAIDRLLGAPIAG
ncbi:MAG TPA: response regulator [Reyranella sp.]|nr:response regulator [Reyranella sp.]